MQQTRLRRSVLFVPGDKPRALDKIPSLNTDAVILDLEDAVAPSKKEEARTAVCGLNRSQRQRKVYSSIFAFIHTPICGLIAALQLLDEEWRARFWR